MLADVALIAVAHQSAGKHAGLAEDLEAVADPHDEAAAGSKLRDGLHNGGEPCDGARAEIIAVGKSARHKYGLAAFKVMRGMPKVGNRRSEFLRKDVIGVVVAI